MSDVLLDTSGLWELAREKSDLCESLPGSRKPKTSRPKNSNDRTIAYTVPLNYNFIFTRVNTRGATQYFAC